MGTIWTPGGERRVPAAESGEAQPQPMHPPSDRRHDGLDADDELSDTQLSDTELAARMEQLQAQLAATPAEAVVANHCYGLFELAALHLGTQPPQLEQARLAIDALGALVEGLAGRLGEHEKALGEGLAQLRLAFVQIRAADQASRGQPSEN